MTVTHQQLVSAASQEDWTCTEGAGLACSTRDGVQITWRIKGAVKATMSRDGVAIAKLRSRQAVLELLLMRPVDLRPAVAYAQQELGGMVIEDVIGTRRKGVRFLEAPRTVDELRQHLAADHGGNGMALHAAVLPSWDAIRLHHVHHVAGQAALWPYVNPHYHTDFSGASAAALLETT